MPKRPRSGLTPEEERVHDSLLEAWSGFVLLPIANDDHVDDFRRSIHECQRILMLRIAHREYPDYWIGVPD